MLASSILDNAGVQVCLITGVIGLFSIVLTGVVKKIFDKPNGGPAPPPMPVPMPVPKPGDGEFEDLRKREPALLSLIVDMRNEIEVCKKTAEEADARARSAEADAQKYREEAKRWQDEVLRLQHLVEGLIERGRGSQN